MRRGAPAIAVALVLMLLAGCASTPAALNDSKKAIKAADSAWSVAQHAFAEAFIDGKLTLDQVEKFRSIDKKVLMTGRLLRDAVKAWDKGLTQDSTRMTLLTTNLLSLMIEGAKLAAEFGLDIKSLLNVAEEAKKAGVR